ncbi:MAG: phytanoyl-CoA dioxygenase family protein [Planctomycetota bacterium]|nr:phytanoyl-CoA dioxygenase family protein [Planctomycetota bacterium]
MFVTADQVEQYRRDGYLIIPNVLAPAQIDLLRAAIDIENPGVKFGDTVGRTARLSFWSDTTSTIWGVASTLPVVVNNVRILQGEDVGFFHGKVTLKEARTGGAWEWHQDYGYWYDQGFVFPRMMSVSIALDRNDVDNGCMQVYRGSHKLGRLNHGRIGNQTGCDADRLEQVARHLELLPVRLNEGDALFFDCLTLHASGPNDADRHRRNFIICYNALGNPQIGLRKTSQETPCPVGPADAIERFAAAQPAGAPASAK